EDVLTSVDFNGHRFFIEPYEDWPSSNGTSSDTLVASDDNDVIFWDLDTTDGMASGSSSQRVNDTDVRQRLPDADASSNRDIEVFDLRNGNDILNLTYDEAGSDDPNGYDGDVTVYGGGGADLIAVSDGADLVYGGTGSDTIYGGGGLDRLFGDNGSTNVNENSGSNDTIYSGEGDNATLWGEGGNDYLQGSGEGIETFYGGAGNDTIHNWSGFGDVAYGGTGDDRIITADTAYGGEGNDHIDGGFGGTGVEGRDTIFGDAGDDTIEGNDADDKLYGGVGADKLYGGTENDELYFSSDAAVGAGAEVRLWNGVSASSTTLSLSGHSYTFDTFYGDDGTDTLVLDDGDNVFVNSPGDLKTSGAGSFGVGGTNRLYGVEIVLAGAGADIIGLNHRDTGPDDSDSIFSSNITIAGEDGDDIIYSGSGNDLLIGGRLGTGDGTGDDTIFGGNGNDFIYGDSRAANGTSTGSGDDLLYGGAGQDTIFGGAGDDTIYGGSGDDYVYGGQGDDLIFDDGSAMGFFSAEGDDIVVMNFNNPGLNKALSITGVDGPADGADQVYALGSYGSVSFALGGDNDIFVGSATANAGGQIDRVEGQSGDDVISTWEGNDTIDGGADNDALWGGAGSDTVYGGEGTDYLYGGWGDNDVLVGGAGTDYYYWSRTDGQGDQIWDDYRGTPAAPGQQADNVLVVFPDFDPTEVNGDGLRTGSGVVETDNDLYDLAGGDDMVRLTDIDGAGGSMYRLTVLTGDGATNYVEFDQRDVQSIMLWNNDNAGIGQVIQTYTWDPIDGRYEFVG
ncbi:MAG: calcium-binding protein, partial [Reyranellaceae bacterium]